ncbi:MAG: hypothetical protein B5M52_01790 [Helicobacteraceae bacterium 4484_230]|nr:MAG: hypothetical protein B5M52_01790 [Helicobacteraceae bacterium 4484_230]
MIYKLNFREVVYALSEALDLVGIDDIYHGKRVAFMAAECAFAAGYDEEFIDELIYLGMLHDCGVSTTDMHRNLVTRLEWKDESIHCERGYMLLHKTKLFEKYADVIYYHHTHWEELKNIHIDEKTKIQANLIYLVDRVDALRAQIDLPPEQMKDEIYRIILEHEGTFFSSELIKSFLQASKKASFWFFLEDDALEEYLYEWKDMGSVNEYTYDELREIAVMFADIVDTKSPFTAQHSFGVASLSLYLGKKAGLDRRSLETLELAALLHDLGKLRIDDEVLNKPGKLNVDERLSLNRHGFDSDLILRKIKGFKKIARLASLHHETLDGEGYPYRLKSDDIPLEARIIAVSDIFQALIQNRPYREAMSAVEAFEILSGMADNGKLDKEVIGLMQENLEEVYDRAVVSA